MSEPTAIERMLADPKTPAAKARRLRQIQAEIEQARRADRELGWVGR